VFQPFPLPSLAPGHFLHNWLYLTYKTKGSSGGGLASTAQYLVKHQIEPAIYTLCFLRAGKSLVTIAFLFCPCSIHVF